MTRCDPRSCRFPWTLTRVTRGHFLSPTSEDAALSMEGCEPHSENFAGTILLTKHDGQWVMDWYKEGSVTQQCHKIRLKTGRDILVCIGQSGAQGVVWTDLYLEDLLHPTANLMAERPESSLKCSTTRERVGRI